MNSVINANDIQHGGDHYKTEYQHWDLMADIGYSYEYYMAAATKYLARHEKKNGREDVQKAYHYTRKLIELVTTGKVTLAEPLPTMKQYAVLRSVERFLNKNGRTEGCLEARAYFHLCRPVTMADLTAGIGYIDEILKMYDRGEVIAVVDRRRSTSGYEMTHRDFYAEGFVAHADMYQCKFCKEHITVRPNGDPSKEHDCPKSQGYVNQDSVVGK